MNQIDYAPYQFDYMRVSVSTSTVAIALGILREFNDLVGPLGEADYGIIYAVNMSRCWERHRALVPWNPDQSRRLILVLNRC
jgi:hypothetical protein